ncbi:DNA gyrase subunit B [Muribaculaceae bacterium]|jgi:topoisomerase-4 subunit B|nr:DNA topoisomerase IV subunit B [Muribaculaceae bacterium]GFI06348.1 DNA gyrase subunit B [Muribaculaceae bacterium]
MAEDEELDLTVSSTESNYTGDDIVTLDWKEHIRRRPGMYIGKLGDGTTSDDGIYVLLKEVMDNAIDEYMMGFGKQVLVDVSEHSVSIRDFGRGIPLDKVMDVSSKMNTGAKYDSKAFKKSVGLNGVGIKAVNALSQTFTIRSVRDGQAKQIVYCKGEVVDDCTIVDTDEPNGTLVEFVPDATIFRDYRYRDEFIVPLLKNYTFLNTGLAVIFNGKRFISRNGLADLLKENMTKEPLYPLIHLKGEDIEVVITHAEQYGDEYYSFVNGQHTTQGGTHLSAFREASSRTIKEFFGRNFEYSDIRNGMVAAVSVKVEEPVFESQTKTKLGSRDMGPDGPTVAKFIGDFIKRELDNYLHRNKDTAEIMLAKVQTSERDRKAMAGVTKAARERAKKVNLHNPKLRDCQIHFNDAKGDDRLKQATSIFITEGDSAAGSITKIRDVHTQAVFSLRGKPLNTYGLTQKVVYENEEFNLLQAALNIEDGIDSLRYNQVIIATDADVDGMHIRLLLLTFFLQFFPDLIKKGHVYVLQTPLFRVRNKKTTKRGRKASDAEEVYYCYSDDERIAAIEKLGANAEITRFKGLGEISPDEFRGFIGADIRLDRVSLRKEDGVAGLLEFYMGKNTPDRQQFILENLVVEDDSEIL